MAIVGFNFTKINIEKLSENKGQIKINNNATISKIEETDLALGTSKQKALKFSFEFVSDYEPKIGKITLNGYVIDIGKSASEIKKHISDWKEKKLPDDVAKPVINYILEKCNVEAIILSRDVNLPSPVPLPKLK